MQRQVFLVIGIAALGFCSYLLYGKLLGVAAPSIPFEYQTISIQPGEFVLHIPINNSYEITYLEKKIRFESAFQIGKYEVTNDQWNICFKQGGCAHTAQLLDGEGGNHPVVRINWHDAYQFSQWLTTTTKQSYRLPTEEEWVYVAYMGQEHKGSEVEYDYSDLNRIKEIVKITKPVGTFSANKWGLFDYLGNVWEWTLTCWFASDQNILKNYSIKELNTPSACTTRIAQGDNRSHIPDFIYDTYSGGCSTLRPAANLGFRLVREP